MNRYRGMGLRMAMAWRGSLALVAMLLLFPVLNVGGLAAAEGPGPVFSGLQASSNEVEAGGMVFLTVQITSPADIVGNPMVSYLFPDGTPGPAVAFSRISGSLRDGAWQATLQLSAYLPSGTYLVNDLRAVNAAGNSTIYDPSDDDTSDMNRIGTTVVTKLRAIGVMGNASADPIEHAAAGPPTNANLTVKNTAQEPEDTGAVNDITMRTTAAKSTVGPLECNNPHPNGPFFTRLSFSSGNVGPGDRITVIARIIDCDVSNYDFAGASIRLQYECNDGSTKEGPLATWVRTHGPPEEYMYTTTLTLFKPSPCKSHHISIKELRAWDGQGYDNRFAPNRAYWPVYSRPTVKSS